VDLGNEIYLVRFPKMASATIWKSILNIKVKRHGITSYYFYLEGSCSYYIELILCTGSDWTGQLKYQSHGPIYAISYAQGISKMFSAGLEALFAPKMGKYELIEPRVAGSDQE